jgi:hypothetical protein
MSNQLQNVKYVSITPPAAILDNASATTAEIDTLGFEYLSIICQVGATDIAMTALKVTESDTSGSGHADVTGLVFGTSTDIDGNASALPSATDDNKFFVFLIDLRGRKRYIDLTATMGDGTAGGYFSAIGVLSRGATGPTTEATMNAQVLAV